MRLSRFGFNLLVCIWLAPLLALDIVGNTRATGDASDFYYYKALVDGVLLLMAGYFVLSGNVVAKIQLHAAEEDGETVASIENIRAFEPYYCGLLALYAALSWWMLHEVNKNSTGVISLASLIWSLISIGIAVLSGIQCYRLNRKSISSLKSRMLQE